MAALLIVVVPGVKANVERARSVKCRENIGKIYRGLNSYEFDNGGWWPEQVIRTQAGLIKDQNVWVSLVSENKYVGELETFICPSDPNAPRAKGAIKEYLRRRVSYSPSYGLNQLVWLEYGTSPSDDPGIRRAPKDTEKTILLADLGPDVPDRDLPGEEKARRERIENARDAGRLVPDDGFRIGVVQPPSPWLTTRHNARTNLMAMGGNTSQQHDVRKLIQRIPESFYDDCATGDCTFCNVFRSPHYDFSSSKLFFWTGRYYDNPPAAATGNDSSPQSAGVN